MAETIPQIKQETEDTSLHTPHHGELGSYATKLEPQPFTCSMFPQPDTIADPAMILDVDNRLGDSEVMSVGDNRLSEMRTGTEPTRIAMFKDVKPNLAYINRQQTSSRDVIDEVDHDEDVARHQELANTDTATAIASNNTPDLHGVIQDNLMMLESVLNVVGNVECMSDEDTIGTSDEESDMDDSTFDSNNNETAHKDFESYPSKDMGGSTFDSNNNETVHMDFESNPSKDGFDSKSICSKPSSLYPVLDNVKDVATGVHLKGQTSAQSRKHECRDCFRTFTRKDNLNRHIKRETCKRTSSTKTSGKPLPTKTTRKNSSTKTEPKTVKLYECNLCLKVLTTKYGYIYHMEDHKGIRYTCASCGQSYSRQRTLDAHMKLHRTDKAGGSTTYIPCGVCQKMFAKETNLALHMQVHTGTQKHACNTCDARFSRKSDLAKHETTHTGEKPYKCGLCHKSFRSQGDLGRHRKWHNGGHTCKFCGKRYVRKDEFSVHMSKHVTNGDITPSSGDATEKKSHHNSVEHTSQTWGSHVCKVCSAELATELNLRNHMLTHERHNTVKMRFKCGVCEEKFSTSSNRSRHMKRYHAEPESILKCDICSKAFPIACELKRHVRQAHLQQWPYPCSHCEKGFDKEREYVLHMNSKHPHEEMNIHPPRPIGRPMEAPEVMNC